MRERATELRRTTRKRRPSWRMVPEAGSSAGRLGEVAAAVFAGVAGRWWRRAACSGRRRTVSRAKKRRRLQPARRPSLPRRMDRRAGELGGAGERFGLFSGMVSEVAWMSSGGIGTSVLGRMRMSPGLYAGDDVEMPVDRTTGGLMLETWREGSRDRLGRCFASFLP